MCNQEQGLSGSKSHEPYDVDCNILSEAILRKHSTATLLNQNRGRVGLIDTAALGRFRDCCISLLSSFLNLSSTPALC